MRLTDLDIVEQAVKLLRDKFDIDLIIAQCSIEAQTAGKAVGIDGTVLRVGREPELCIDLAVNKDHGGWTEHMDVSYAIYSEDLEDDGLVDELIGGDLKKHSPNMRQVLRLAFILYGGIRCAMTGEHKKAYTNKGWRSRVIGVQRQSCMK